MREGWEMSLLGTGRGDVVRYLVSMVSIPYAVDAMREAD